MKPYGIILYDWLSFTAEYITPENMMYWLGLEDLEFTIVEKKAHGYKKRYYFDGINIHFDNPKDEHRIWVEMSGQGCRAFDEFSKLDWLSLFKKLQEPYYYQFFAYKCHVTRLDVAYDDKNYKDKDGLLDIDRIFKETDKENYISPTTARKCISSDKGRTVEIGAKSSEIMFRIYDKARERNLDEDEIPHWIRFEMQLRRERANEFIKNLLSGYTIGELFAGVCRNYLNYVHPSKTESNKSRWEIQRWWAKFTKNASKISLWTAKTTDYNMKKAEKHVYRQNGNAIDTLIKVKGFERFYSELQKNKPEKVSEKYQSLIAEYGKYEPPKQENRPKVVEKPVYMYRCDICGLFKPEFDFTVHHRATGAGKCSECLCITTK